MLNPRTSGSSSTSRRPTSRTGVSRTEPAIGTSSRRRRRSTRIANRVSLEFRGFPYEIAEHRPSRSLSSRHASRRARESSLLRTAFYFRRDRVDPRLDVGGTARKSREACRELRWLRPDGRLKDMSRRDARVAMLRIERDGLITLPPPRNGSTNGRHRPRFTPASNPQDPVCDAVCDPVGRWPRPEESARASLTLHQQPREEEKVDRERPSGPSARKILRTVGGDEKRTSRRSRPRLPGTFTKRRHRSRTGSLGSGARFGPLAFLRSRSSNGSAGISAGSCRAGFSPRDFRETPG